MAISTSNLGALTNAPKQVTSDYLTDVRTEWQYAFSTSSRSSINLSLYNISGGDDADLILYQDVNRNSIVDSGDRSMMDSTNSSNADDSVNYQADAGNYIAVIRRYPSSQGVVEYDLALSATSPKQPANLLPKEYNLGDIRLGSILNTDPNRTRTIVRSGLVGNDDTVDTYYFTAVSRGDGTKINVSLTGLSADADVRLIQDFNGNRIVDANEVSIAASSTNSGTSNESFSKYLSNYSLSQYGGAFIQVYQYSGNTNYTLNTTLTSTLG
ncbi:MAG TPA: hypothetical protein V6C65_15750 [Allocoleopsis sp.]